MTFFRKLGFGNRRAQAREVISPPLKCIFSCPQSGQEGLLAYIIDISKNGALVSVNGYSFVVGSNIELRPQMHSGVSSIIARGVIVRIRKGAQSWCALGIKFDKRSEKDLGILLDYIAKRT
ncbi:MAG: PilZ domain-containing protein [Candidatus Omnitrophica bacterium]|nr:PilZ domain-containing protein [Candidatus Omnitrophota bacterium]